MAKLKHHCHEIYNQTEIKNNVIKNLYEVKAKEALVKFEALKRGFIFFVYTLVTFACMLVYFENSE